VLDTINSSHDLRRFPLAYHPIKRFFFNLDAIPRRAPRVQNSRQRKLQAERKEFQKLSADEKEFVRIRKNRDKALFGAVEDQCNDSVGLLMAALAYRRFSGTALYRVNETEVPDTSNYVFK
jgi:hypothetical protein